MGLIGKDVSLFEGKNLSNFCLFYTIGAFLKYTNKRWKDVSPIILFLCFFVLNFLICLSYHYAPNNLSNYIWKLSFPYHSPFILISSVLFLCMIANTNIKSVFVNRLAKSTFAIYLLHCSGLANEQFNKPMLQFIIDVTSSKYEVYFSIFTYSVIVFWICLLIDQLLSPMWNQIHILLNKKCKVVDLSV